MGEWMVLRNRWIDIWCMDGWMDGWIDILIDGWKDRWIDG
jgi:hypothetical protein